MSQARSFLPASTTRSSFIFIIADTLRAKDLRLYGGEVAAPNLEALAARGAVFERAYALAPWTLPSMTGMLASQMPDNLVPSREPDALRGQLWQYRIPENLPTLQERLQEKGYTTAAITANPVLWGVAGMSENFDVTATAHPILLHRDGLFRMTPTLQKAVARWFPTLAPLRPADTSSALTRYADAFLSRTSGPAYLWLHYIDPHTPYAPPDRYRTIKGGWPFFYPYPGGERWDIPQLGQSDMKFSEEKRALVQDLYRGEIKYLDELVGTLLQRVEQLGLEDTTYICLTSDHGEELWEHGEWGHGQALYDESIHVPWIMTGPGIKPCRIAPPVSHLDFMPTMAELLELPQDAAWEGRSLASSLRSGTAPEDVPVFSRGTNDRVPEDPLECVVLWPHKLIRGTVSGDTELYDLQRDPAETRDLSDVHHELRAALANLLDGLPENAAVEPKPDGGEVMQQLESMGYL